MRLERKKTTTMVSTSAEESEISVINVSISNSNSSDEEENTAGFGWPQAYAFEHLVRETKHLPEKMKLLIQLPPILTQATLEKTTLTGACMAIVLWCQQERNVCGVKKFSICNTG